jgi:hypothetical protein
VHAESPRLNPVSKPGETVRADRAPARSDPRHRGLVSTARSRSARFTATTPSDWILRLAPQPEGWSLEIATVGREHEDLARLTPPWHFVPNPRDTFGWHFRSAENTAPNDRTVNAPQELREFIFSPEVGRGIEYTGCATTREEVERVRAFGRGGLFIESYELTPPRRGERASFETLTFSACLTWPAM